MSTIHSNFILSMTRLGDFMVRKDISKSGEFTLTFTMPTKQEITISRKAAEVLCLMLQSHLEK